MKQHNQWWFASLSLLLVVGSIIIAYPWTTVSASESYVAIGVRTTLNVWAENYTVPTIIETKQNNYELSYAGGKNKIILGNGTNNFESKLKFGRWEDEAVFTIGLPLTFTGNLGRATLSGGTVSVSNNNFEFYYSPTIVKHGFNDLGGLDLIVVLKKKPSTNVLTFTYDSTLVDALLQPALTPSEIDENAQRPDYVLNSIALYGRGKSGDLSALGGKNYRAGKVGHLYNMKLTAADGSSVWGAWTVGSNTLAFTVPQVFLDTKPYPMTLAPIGDTFGYTTAGGTSFGISVDGYRAFRATGAAGTVTSISFYASLGSGSLGVRGGLYQQSDDALVSPQGNEVTVNSSTPQWWTSTVDAGPTISAVDYWVTYFTDYASPGLVGYYDSGAPANYYRRRNVTYPNWPNPMVYDAQSNLNLSVYSTYTPTSTIAISNTPTTYDFGTVTASSTSNTTTGYFTVDNTSSVTTNVTISVTVASWSGGVTWAHSDTATAGADQAGLKASKNSGAYDVVVKNASPNNIASNQAANTDFQWELQLIAPTSFTDGVQKSITVRLTATAA